MQWVSTTNHITFAKGLNVGWKPHARHTFCVDGNSHARVFASHWCLEMCSSLQITSVEIHCYKRRRFRTLQSWFVPSLQRQSGCMDETTPGNPCWSIAIVLPLGLEFASVWQRACAKLWEIKEGREVCQILLSKNNEGTIDCRANHVLTGLSSVSAMLHRKHEEILSCLLTSFAPVLEQCLHCGHDHHETCVSLAFPFERGRFPKRAVVSVLFWVFNANGQLLWIVGPSSKTMYCNRKLMYLVGSGVLDLVGLENHLHKVQLDFAASHLYCNPKASYPLETAFWAENISVTRAHFEKFPLVLKCCFVRNCLSEQSLNCREPTDVGKIMSTSEALGQEVKDIKTDKGKFAAEFNLFAGKFRGRSSSAENSTNKRGCFLEWFGVSKGQGWSQWLEPSRDLLTFLTVEPLVWNPRRLNVKHKLCSRTIRISESGKIILPFESLPNKYEETLKGKRRLKDKIAVLLLEFCMWRKLVWSMFWDWSKRWSAAKLRFGKETRNRENIGSCRCADAGIRKTRYLPRR